LVIIDLPKGIDPDLHTDHGRRKRDGKGQYSGQCQRAIHQVYNALRFATNEMDANAP